MSRISLYALDHVGDEIMATLKGFKSVGRLKKLPDDGIHYKWPTL